MSLKKKLRIEQLREIQRQQYLRGDRKKPYSLRTWRLSDLWSKPEPRTPVVRHLDL